MTKKEDKERKSHRDLLLILLILPFGVLCMFLTGQVAVKLAPTWILPADMLSHQDPNSDFSGLGIPLFLEPLDPGILTQPPWDLYYLTPNASYPTRSPATQVPIRTVQPPPPVVNTPEEEKPPPSTATVVGPIILPTRPGPQVAELVVTKTDNSPTYTPGTSINYTIVVQNLGPDDAPRFNVIDNIPAVVAGLTANCAPTGSCGTNTSSGNRVSFTAASIYFDQTDRIVITVSGLVASSATGNLSNSVQAIIPQGAGYRDDNLGNNTATDTDSLRSVYDVDITKSDGVDTFTAATTQLNYTVNVINHGPSDAWGITINDNKPSQFSSWGWCVAPCTPDPNANTSNFSDTVNIPSGGSIEYSFAAALDTSLVEDISNTANIVLPSGPGTIVDPNLANNSATDTSIPLVDLVVDKNGTAPTYTAGGFVSYTITVTNNSTFVVNNVNVVDNIPALIDPTTWTWTCTPNPPPGANCDTPSGTGNINTTVDLPPGTSVIFAINNALVRANAIGTLENTATISPPTGLTDSTPGNNTDTFSETNPNGPNVGPPDNVVISPAGGTTSTYFFSPAITNNGTGTPDFVFFERDTGSGIALDIVVVSISNDGINWTQVFNWGDGSPDANSNVSSAVGPECGGTEYDDCPIPASYLYSSNGYDSGITIDIDSLGLSGTYPWIQFYCPTTAEGNTDNLCDIDSIQPYYP